MKKKTKDRAEDQAPGLFPIRTVSELTGVNPITLRAWETRYGLIKPIRKSSGHRLYTQEHIDLINRVVGLLDRGMRIGQVNAEIMADKPDEGDSADQKQDIWQRHINGMIAAIIRFDEFGLERIYGEALSHYPVRTVTKKLLGPLMRELGERWETGRGSIAEEHFFGFYLRNKLGARFHHRSQNQSGPKLLLACLPGDLHEIGLLLFALGASDHGYQTVLLGANMPLEELPAAVKKTACDALVLSGVIEPDESVIKDQLPRLVARLSIPVFLGGAIAATHFDGLKKSGVHLIGTDINSGIKQISAQLGH
ncbi:MAG: MerR family transcriptional regulator [Gammaproteobacteria bacterium]|nr:MerR family transcriptional regulator [Gammaproteobacteria bacterium]NNK99755.1 MerR family transcriptional regulator [Xanthomonadales bacterium]